MSGEPGSSTPSTTLQLFRGSFRIGQVRIGLQLHARHFLDLQNVGAQAFQDHVIAGEQFRAAAKAAARLPPAHDLDHRET